jgi:hypothetical protein
VVTKNCFFYILPSGLEYTTPSCDGNPEKFGTEPSTSCLVYLTIWLFGCPPPFTMPQHVAIVTVTTSFASYPQNTAAVSFFLLILLCIIMMSVILTLTATSCGARWKFAARNQTAPTNGTESCAAGTFGPPPRRSLRAAPPCRQTSRHDEKKSQRGRLRVLEQNPTCRTMARSPSATKSCGPATSPCIPPVPSSSRAPQSSSPAPAWQTAVACTGPGHPPSMPRRCVRGSPSSIVLLLDFTFVFFFSVRAESSRLFLHFIHRCKRHRPSFFLTLPLCIRACFSSGCAVAA